METQYENNCRVKFYELLDKTERIDGYSHSQLVSVMVVMNCEPVYARQLLDRIDTYSYIDWSEATWHELRDEFTALEIVLSEVVHTQQSAIM
jgi:hypothetical protein